MGENQMLTDLDAPDVVQSAPVASFETFAAVVADYFDLPEGSVSEQARLGDDLAFDSVALLECHMMLEELAGHLIDDQALATLQTAGDLYRLYVFYAE